MVNLAANCGAKRSRITTYFRDIKGGNSWTDLWWKSIGLKKKFITVACTTATCYVSSGVI